MSPHEPLPAKVIPGHDLLSLIAGRGGRCDLDELEAAVQQTFGPEAVFGNCHGDLFDFPAVLAFLESKGKIALAGYEVTLSDAPACSGH
jgi:probable metal-binding protein